MGKIGKQPSTLTRAYVYGVTATMLDNDINGDRMWFLYQIDNEAERARILKEVRKLRDSLRKKREKLLAEEPTP